METFVTWVLIMTFVGIKSGGPVVIDNIATKQNCEALATQIKSDWIADKRFGVSTTKCIAVRKVKP